MGAKCNVFVVLLAILAGAVYISLPGDILTGVSSDTVLTGWQLQLAVTGFCLSNVPSKFMETTYGGEGRGDAGGDFKFEDDGNMDSDDYSKGSIYSMLYALYGNVGTVKSNLGVPYEFTFNTWGFAPSPYPVEDPQRHGKAAYSGLVNFPEVKKYLKDVTDAPKIVEIGCGTGAGANLITREILKKADYLAIDMQLAAIAKCKERHGNATNPGLKCVQAPGGVGNNGNKVLDAAGKMVPDGSIDFVIISETHIADIDVREEEKEIFREIFRILKPGGFFLWGNALPTWIWHKALPILENEIGLKRVNSLNHTKGAVIARDEDEARVNSFVSEMMARYPVFEYTGSRGKTCGHVVDRLLKNFYRHPGTALYLKMVTGFDSYMHEAYQKPM
jgi:SAM-dependent methyltransferase